MPFGVPISSAIAPYWGHRMPIVELVEGSDQDSRRIVLLMPALPSSGMPTL